MTKQEMYDKIVNVYKESGQGIMSLISMSYPNAIEALLNDGKIKKVSIPFSHLPNSDFYCLTNVYCAEEDINVYKMALHYMRFYLGIHVDLGGFDLNIDEKYQSWLKVNKEALDKIKSTPYYDGTSTTDIVDVTESGDEPVTITEDDKIAIDFIKSEVSYDKEIFDCIKDFSKICDLDEQIISMSKRAIRISSSHNVTKYEDTTKESEDRSNAYKKVITYLKKFDSSKKIKDII